MLFPASLMGMYMLEETKEIENIVSSYNSVLEFVINHGEVRVNSGIKFFSIKIHGYLITGNFFMRTSSCLKIEEDSSQKILEMILYSTGNKLVIALGSESDLMKVSLNLKSISPIKNLLFI